jgi:hypothetical protein
MRPERSRETGRAARAARARMLVKADLGWLGGYPTGDETPGSLAWLVPPGAGRPARETTLDRASLHRSTRALAELELRFADVLDDVVEEPRIWKTRVRAAIELLKPVVHGAGGRGEASERLLASAIHRADVVASMRSAPRPLRPVLDAAAWITVTSSARLPRIAAFALAHADVSAALGATLDPAEAERATLHLALLAGEEGARRIEPLAHMLASRALHDMPTSGVDYARSLAKQPRGERAARPKATLGPALAAWTTRLLTADARARRGALGLLGALDLAPVVQEWSAWWSRIARCEALAQSQPESEDDARARAKATRLADGAPRPVRGESLAELLAGALTWDEATLREATRALAELPALEGGVPVRLAFLEHWAHLAEDAKPGTTSAVLAGFSRYLARTRACGPRRLLPWARILDRTKRPVWSAMPEDSLVDDLPQAQWPAFYEALARAVEDESADPSHLAPALLAILKLEKDAARALALARETVPHLGWAHSGEGLRTVHELFGAEPARFGQALSAVGNADSEADREYLLRGLAAVRKSGGDDLARSLLLDEGERLVPCGRRLAVLALAGGARDLDAVRPAAADPPWATAYPAWVGPALRRLAAADVHAERLARRLLGDEVRAASAVRREVEHLEALAAGPRGATERVQRRIANLRARLAAPRPVRAELRANLVAKVERAARRATLARIEGALEAGLRARLPAFLGLDPPPPWLFTPRAIEQLAPIGSFDPAMRTLALRVVRARAGPAPWDLRDEPANRAFLDRLIRAGADVGPWLDGSHVQHVTTAEGKEIDLRLEDDPLEVLDMGKHFATCLSPGGINYFSTFANVADANKRVLYGRDAAGRIVARCLLALTAAGGLLAFHPYAHDGSLGFDAIVAEYARDLAARMRVLVVPQGSVPRVVAPDWYDDGPVDLGGRFPFLQDGSAFRLSIPAATPSSFVEEASRLFAPLPLGALTLPLLVALPEIDARPELLSALLPALADAEGLPLGTVARAVGLLARTPDAVVASRALVPRIVAGLRRATDSQDDDDRGWLAAAVSGVVEACPSDALRLLRATRARRVRSWTDEHDPRRLEMAARAFELLRRPRLAAQGYRLAAKHAWSTEARKKLEEKAAALEASLRVRR